MSESSFSQGGRPLVVAHRGASSSEPENTAAAFEAAIVAGADAVELDVRMAADGIAVVMHDADVSRTTNGRGLVRDLTSEQIRRLRIPTADGGGAEVPTLEDTLAACSGRVGVDLEIKNVPGEPDFEPDRQRAVEAALNAIDHVAFSGMVLLSSFNPLSIARSRVLSPDVPTGLLTDHRVDARAALGFAHEEGHAWVLPFLDRVDEAGSTLADDAHDMGMRVGTWLTDAPAVAVALMRSGLDAVATNDPAAIVAARAEAGLG